MLIKPAAHLLHDLHVLRMSSLWPARGGRVMKMTKRTIKSPNTHPYIAIFEVGFPSDDMTMPWKFSDDICNDSGVIVLTGRETDIRTKRSHKQTLLKTIPPSLCYAARRGWLKCCCCVPLTAGAHHSRLASCSVCRWSPPSVHEWPSSSATQRLVSADRTEP